MGAGLLAVVPARGGSKGLPGKNIRPFAGLPLLAHSILCAKRSAAVARCVVSTDSAEIAEVARRAGGDVPFLRPAELAQDDTPIWPVLRHALAAVERDEGVRYDGLLLLDPTSPAREPEELVQAWQRLQAAPGADGIIGVSKPSFNPVWHCVIERDGWMSDLFTDGHQFMRRQDAPAVYRINGSLYVWRAEFVRRQEGSWRPGGRHLLFEIPEQRAMSIDTDEQFRYAEWLVQQGVITFPWLDSKPP